MVKIKTANTSDEIVALMNEGGFDLVTASGDAFALKKGVCQDYSQIMIACLRSIGIPAGYVSGLLRTTSTSWKAKARGSRCHACLGNGMVLSRGRLGRI